MTVQKDALLLLAALKKDHKIWAISPCGHEYRLSDSELFYGSELTPKAKEFLDLQNEGIKQLKKEAKDFKYKLTEGFTKKSVEVKIGKTIEKIVPVLPGFPYNPLDCRSLFDPIDYTVFVGASKDSVSHIDFVDIKTGNARLSPVQKTIRDVVLDGKVNIRVVNR
ncbi:MAG: Holliday junction resolvase-like protein [Candidatus Aenigmatarchaeota archaeon]